MRNRPVIIAYKSKAMWLNLAENTKDLHDKNRYYRYSQAFNKEIETGAIHCICHALPNLECPYNKDRKYI